MGDVIVRPLAEHEIPPMRPSCTSASAWVSSHGVGNHAIALPDRFVAEIHLALMVSADST